MPFKDPVKAKEYHRKYYLEHEKEFSKRSKERYLKDSEKIKERSCLRYHEYREKIAKYKRKKYQKNKEEIDEKNKKWALNNPDKIIMIKKNYRDSHRNELRKKGREYAKSHRKQANKLRKERRKNKEIMKKEKLKDKYGITLEFFNSMLKEQNYKCGVCGKIFVNDPAGKNALFPCIDHDHSKHKGQSIRGLLCRKCNGGIGNLKDDPKLLLTAFNWLNGNVKFERKTSEFNFKIRPRYKYNIKGNFKITIDQFKEMFLNQNGRCGICNIPFESKVPDNPAIDHCHASGKIRGLLCSKCNSALGMLNDDPEIIKNAIKWLTKGYIYADDRS